MSAPDKNTQGLPVVQRVVSVFWPSFLSASLATVIFFTVFDPIDLAFAAGIDRIEPLAVYTIGFFCFWLLTSLSCALTCYFRRPSDTFNRHH